MSKQATNRPGRTPIVEYRRAQVARLKLRGLSEREIAEALARAPLNLRNRQTGEPWSVATIRADLRAIRAHWLQESKKHADAHVARLLAELQEAKRLAWSQQDVKTLLAILRQESQLLGIDAPAKVSPATTDGKKPYLLAAEQLNDEQLWSIASIRQLISKGAARTN